VKSEKGNGICRKNKEGTRRSRSSIKKSTGEDEKQIERREGKEWNIGDKLMLSTKDLVFFEYSKNNQQEN